MSRPPGQCEPESRSPSGDGRLLERVEYDGDIAPSPQLGACTPTAGSRDISQGGDLICI